jgi:hypothetical protein
LAADQATSGKTTSGDVGAPQTFRSVTAVIVWWIWVLFAVANLIDLAVQGRDHLSLVSAGILVLITGVAYDTAQRPRVVAADDGITVRNPLRDHHIPWPSVARVDVSDLLRIHCRPPGPTAAEQVGLAAPSSKSGKIISAWAVHYSRRRQYSTDIKARRAAVRESRGSSRTTGHTPFGIPQPASGRRNITALPDNTPEAEAQKIVRLLSDRAATAGIAHATDAAGAAQAKADQAPGTAPASADQAIGAAQAAGAVSAPDAAQVTSTWSWSAIAALVIPVLILVICCLVLRGVAQLRARAAAQVGYVVRRRSCLLRRVGQDADVPRGWQATLVEVQHVQPGQYVTVERLYPDLDLPVVAERDAVPAVEFLLVGLEHVVEHDEDTLIRILDDGRQGPIPPDVRPAERQPPALQPATASLR